VRKALTVMYWYWRWNLCMAWPLEGVWKTYL